MPENMQIIIYHIQREFPDFTGRITFDMLQGEVGATEKTEKKRYVVKKSHSPEYSNTK